MDGRLRMDDDNSVGKEWYGVGWKVSVHTVQGSWLVEGVKTHTQNGCGEIDGITDFLLGTKSKFSPHGMGCEWVPLGPAVPYPCSLPSSPVRQMS